MLLLASHITVADTLSSVADSAGNTWQTPIDVNVGTGVGQGIAYAANTTANVPVGSTVTATFSGSTVAQISVRCVSRRADANTPIDKHNNFTTGTASTSATVSTGTLSQATELIIGFVSLAGSGSGNTLAQAALRCCLPKHRRHLIMDASKRLLPHLLFRSLIRGRWSATTSATSSPSSPRCPTPISRCRCWASPRTTIRQPTTTGCPRGCGAPASEAVDEVDPSRPPGRHARGGRDGTHGGRWPSARRPSLRPGRSAGLCRAVRPGRDAGPERERPGDRSGRCARIRDGPTISA